MTNGIRISAAKKYPVAITRMEKLRVIETWAYKRIAVTKSHRNIAVT